MIPAGEARRGRQSVEQPTHRVGILEGSHTMRGRPYLDYLDQSLVPFHYAHPVTGKQT